MATKDAQGGVCVCVRVVLWSANRPPRPLRPRLHAQGCQDFIAQQGRLRNNFWH